MINIDGVEYVPIDSIELDGSTEDIQERLSRAKDELNSKKQKRQQVENDRKLADHINKHYANSLKNVAAFTQLCKTKNLTADDDSKEILNLYKSLPKAARKGALSRFFKL